MAINLGDISRFKYLAHKVMPLVFDETLSYYEFLCKVIAKLNEVIDNENLQNDTLEQFSVDMDNWEEAAIQRYNEFTAEVDLAIEQFEQSVTESQESFEEAIRDRADQFEETMTERADQFEDDITDQQDDFETEIRGAWDEFFQTYLQTLGVVQVTGTSTTDVMSQKAVTDSLDNVVSYSSQSKTTSEKIQAQTNIGLGNVLNDIHRIDTEIYSNIENVGTGEIVTTAPVIESVTFSGAATSATFRNVQMFEPKLPTMTYSGVTVTNEGHGVFTLSGTTTAAPMFNLNKTARTGQEDPIAVNDTLSFGFRVISGSVTNISATGAAFETGIRDGTDRTFILGGYYNFDTGYNNAHGTTGAINFDSLVVSILFRAGVQFNDLKVELSVVKGNTVQWIDYMTPVTLSIPSDDYTTTANTFTPNLWIKANDSSTTITVNELYTKFDEINNEISEIDETVDSNTSALNLINYRNSIICANHRGYSNGYPENTFWSFAQSKIRGFKWVETDVRLTSDGVGVLLHDASINRVARDSSGNELPSEILIADITYEQALTYDFGIASGAEFAGTKIVRLDDFLKFCKRVGLKAELELKASGTGTYAAELVQQYGMEDNVMYISFTDNYLDEVNDVYDNVTLGLLLNSDTMTETFINNAIALKTNNNKVFVKSYYSVNISSFKSTMIENEIGYGIRATDSLTNLKSADPYFFEVTTNSQNFDNLLCTDALEEWT